MDVVRPRRSRVPRESNARWKDGFRLLTAHFKSTRPSSCRYLARINAISSSKSCPGSVIIAMGAAVIPMARLVEVREKSLSLRGVKEPSYSPSSANGDFGTVSMVLRCTEVRLGVKEDYTLCPRIPRMDMNIQ